MVAAVTLENEVFAAVMARVFAVYCPKLEYASTETFFRRQKLSSEVPASVATFRATIKQPNKAHTAFFHRLKVSPVSPVLHDADAKISIVKRD